MEEENDKSTIYAWLTALLFVSVIATFVFLWEGVAWKKASYVTAIPKGSIKTADESETELIMRNIAMLDSTDQKLVEQAAWRLEQRREKAISSLVSELDSKNNSIRKQSNLIYLIGRISVDEKGSIPALISKLEHSDPDIRAISARALGKIGKNAKTSVPFLANLLNDENTWVKESAAIALQKIGTKDALKSLKKYNVN